MKSLHSILCISAPLLLAAAAFAQFPQPPVPPGNPITPAKVQLGKALFWDEQLSSTRLTACGTCHIPAAGGSDPRSALPNASVHPGPDLVFGTLDDVIGSPGVPLSRADATYEDDPSFGLDVQVTRRKAPTMINAAFVPELFWDGRAGGTFADPLTGQVLLPTNGALENQALGPVLSTAEMGHLGRDLVDVADRVAGSRPLALAESVPPPLAQWIGSRSYPELFTEAFGSPDVTPTRIAFAIATYERTLVSAQTPFDAFTQGVPGALTMQQQMGLNLFNNPQNACSGCHPGPLFTDDAFHYIGVRPQQEDLGRFEVTGLLPDRGRMRTPGLRNVGVRGPYFHDGSLATLEEVIDFYDRGGDFNAPNKDPRIQPLGLSPGQKAAIVAFLRAGLRDPRVDQSLPPFDRPLLYTESARKPTTFGTGTAGSGGFVPAMVALEPPRLGLTDFTLAVQHARGGAHGMLLFSSAGDTFGAVRRGVRFHVSLADLVQIDHTTIEGTGAGEGFGSIVMRLPASPLLAGTSFYAQWVVFDPAAPGGLAASEATRFELF